MVARRMQVHRRTQTRAPEPEHTLAKRALNMHQGVSGSYIALSAGKQHTCMAGTVSSDQHAGYCNIMWSVHWIIQRHIGRSTVSSEQRHSWPTVQHWCRGAGAVSRGCRLCCDVCCCLYASAISNHHDKPVATDFGAPGKPTKPALLQHLTRVTIVSPALTRCLAAGQPQLARQAARCRPTPPPPSPPPPPFMLPAPVP